MFPQAIKQKHTCISLEQIRCKGLALGLYEKFFSLVSALGCTFVEAVTSPQNTVSLAFHERVGFKALEQSQEFVQPTIARGYVSYDGPGEDRVLLRMNLGDKADGDHRLDEK
jgi:hypothetical protein